MNWPTGSLILVLKYKKFLIHSQQQRSLFILKDKNMRQIYETKKGPGKSYC